MDMKIIKLIAENVKGLKAIEITPDGNFQIIGGKNGQGKSSVLDSIWLALGGKDAAKATDKPIRNGEETAFATVDLGDIVVTRKWKGETTTLEVKSKDGAKYSSPQGMLDKLIGNLSFDPLSFANQDEKKQKATLQELVGINFDKLDIERKGWYEERTFNNVSAKKLEGALSEMTPPNGAPDEEVSASDIISELNAAQDVISANASNRRELEALRANAMQAKNEITELEERLAAKKAAYEQLKASGEALKTEVELLVDPDTTNIQEKLQTVESTNSKVRAAKEYRRIEKEIKSYKEASDFLTKKMQEIDQTKLDTLQSAAFPITGLSLDENGITFNGIPFKQCSAAERLKVSMAMAIAINPQLRVIRILDGSLLDSDNLKLIEEMAKEKDYQVWVEVVDSSGTMGITIENGEIKSEPF
jgi:DNA repair ATPase RecN